MNYGLNILSIIIWTPLVGAGLLFFVPPVKVRLAKLVALLITLATFISSVNLLSFFNAREAKLQFVEEISWLAQFDINYVIGVDGISLLLVLLTTLLTFLLVLSVKIDTSNIRAYLGSILLLETSILGAFLALDAIIFYMFWELMLIPVYFMIGIWGTENQGKSAFKFVIYTAVGSLLMLVAIIYLGYQFQQQFGTYSFLFADWMKLQLSFQQEVMLFLAFALAFAIKIPIFPFHTWLPNAYTSAPTAGTIILAGVMSKLGLYGLIRFCLPIFPQATIYFASLFMLLGLVSIIYGALMAWVQTDLKRLIAYSSISHLGFCVLGYAALNLEGMKGCILQMVNHGLIIAGLFLLVEILAAQTKSRLILDSAGLAVKLPVFATVLFIFVLGAIGFPLTNGFVGEFLVMFGTFKRNYLFGGLAVLGVILGALYMLSWYRRVMFGKFSTANNSELADLNANELLVLLPLLMLILIIGIHPQPLFNLSEATVRMYVESFIKK
ncbi:MAG: NADH-quinone oxidoreductase subunit M [Deltaproteobacteria bacterium]|jgi:NADH-quinone oxidoreductase subunit M|nr:NADH-quinone oxidoreductase subunit M [Deltaproteobacteria bacterium]